ncbi:MAG: mechanosensitive ion channel family protein, partial [Bacilli bacterium]|nr:mechanosensitive ion channel family protein [Bacilli bacterium]
IVNVCNAHAQVLKDPAPFARITASNEYALILTCRAWVNGDDYWGVKFDLIEQVYAAFKENGIKVPFKQLEISYREALAAEKAGK